MSVGMFSYGSSERLSQINVGESTKITNVNFDQSELI